MPDLSLIVPVHNEVDRLPRMMNRLLRALPTAPGSVEIVLVENGSTDDTWAVAQLYAGINSEVRALTLATRGKGMAVRYGMLDACGAWRMMIDCDLAVSIDQLWRLYNHRYLAPVVIASREAPGARRWGEPAHRRVMSHMFARLVRRLCLPGLADSQCGFKLFSAYAAQEVFSLQTLPGMSFDVEVLYIARLCGYSIAEYPVDWWNDCDSRVHLVNDTVRMFRDLLTIRRNDRAGLYNIAPALPRIISATRIPRD